MARALVALAVLVAFLSSELGATSKTSCQRTSAVAAAAEAATGAQTLSVAHEHGTSAPDAGVPVLPQGCSSALALPASVPASPSPATGQSSPLGRLATLGASHDPPPLFRPPRAS
ncbi:MAG: hypothetical protein ACYC4J_11805 [Gemmatimonadaceae bacterium]